MSLRPVAEPRERIVDAAAGLLREGGPGAVTTRGVAAIAGVQAPAIYRLFGDKDGLLEAVAERLMARQVAAKSDAAEAEARSGGDPVDDLRDAWAAQVAFGLSDPHLFRLLSDPARVRTSPAASEGRRVLAARVHRVAAAGRLRVAEPAAVDLLAAAGVGVIQTLLAADPADRDPDLAHAMLDAVLGRVLAAPAEDREDPVRTSALTLRASSEHLDALTPAERRLMAEWLDRIGSSPR